MPAFLSGPLAGRKRFVAVAFAIVVILLYSAQQVEYAPWENGGSPGRLDPDLGGANVEKGGAVTDASSGQSYPQGSSSSSGSKTHTGTGTGTGADSYREHEYDPLHPTKDAAIPPQETPSSNRWIDKPLDKGETSSEGSTSTTEAADDQHPCMAYMSYLRTKPGPESEGKRKFPYARPPPQCRTFKLPEMEDLISSMKTRIQDPDLFRLFENSYPNTLDTMVKWRGHANESEEMELSYVITGDIDAMWLRDSASQIYSYLPLLKASSSPDSLASLWRGLINSHSRYIIISPYCHSFQPPPESGIPPTHNGANAVNHPNPRFDAKKVFDCKWELDSLGSFFQISSAYYERTGDVGFFKKFVWVEAVEAAVDAAGAMRLGTYAEDGKVEKSAYTFFGQTTRGSETLTNNGLGNPVKENGMVRSSFRPSDDACIFQHLTPSNMLWGKYLEEASHIMDKIDTPKAQNLTKYMRSQALGIRRGIAKDAVVKHKKYGKIFAYEVDGYGSANMMDDSNVPSLLSMPLFNFTKTSIAEHEILGDTPAVLPPSPSASPAPTPSSSPSQLTGTSLGTETGDTEAESTGIVADPQTELEKEREKDRRSGESAPDHIILARSSDEDDEIPDHDYAAVYQASRKFIMSSDNPYYMWGPVISGVGGPHLGPGKTWPMAIIVAAMTAYDPISGMVSPEAEVAEQVKMVLDSTAGSGLIHESINSHEENDWSRPWFGWANGLFGELILKMAENESEGKGLLAKSWQD
ncbi:uncharacterized protein MKZ38_002884 [Zalerion maritima]|uniref:Uncharacterized protein n=1 Tax=Zalerion maritima TaxID=339359 RepID=A0AAD5RYL4_9PEZI|nr:uncharacterized protein MKZ38_002884 [Zalerion maritima]